MGINEEILTKTFRSLCRNLEKGVFTIDKSGVKTVELIDENIKGLDPYQKELIFPGRRTPLKYVEQELKWYDSQSLSITGYVDDIEIWRKVADKDGFVNSNYGWCIYSPENHKQFSNVVSELEKNPGSRRAYMIYTRPSMHYDGNRDGMSDHICTFQTQQFIRNNELTYIINQRSCDMIFGLFNDLAWHQEVYRRLFEDLKMTYPLLKVGKINFNIGSAHVYERHFGMLERMMGKNERKTKRVIQKNCANIKRI